MILFKNKITGEIIGKIDGRKHSEAQLRMTMGDPETTEKIVIDWEVVKYVDDKGKTVQKADIPRYQKEKRLVRAIREPNHADKKTFMAIERGELKIRDFKFNNKTGRLNKFVRKIHKLETMADHETATKKDN